MTSENASFPVILGADEVAATGYRVATDAIADALRGGLDPAESLQRSIVDVPSGQLLLMPAEASGYVAVKVVAVAPDNPARGLPRIVGTLMLLDADTLVPLAIMDGAAVTTLRTPAVSAAAARLLYPSGSPARLVVFGSGPQAAGHVRALGEVMELERVRIIARDAGRAGALAAALAAELRIDAAGGAAADVASAVADATVIVCATTSAQPLFAADDVRPGALVIAVGSHEPGVLEMPAELLADAQVVVEDTASALRESGEVVAAVAAGLIEPDSLVDMPRLLRGEVTAGGDRTRIFKSMGMGWEDAVVAAAVWRRHLGGPAGMGE
jgi:ornithine cyclodeaminase